MLLGLPSIINQREESHFGILEWRTTFSHFRLAYTGSGYFGSQYLIDPEFPSTCPFAWVTSHLQLLRLSWRKVCWNAAEYCSLSLVSIICWRTVPKMQEMWEKLDWQDLLEPTKVSILARYSEDFFILPWINCRPSSQWKWKEIGFEYLTELNLGEHSVMIVVFSPFSWFSQEPCYKYFINHQCQEIPDELNEVLSP